MEQRHMELLHEIKIRGIAAWNRDTWNCCMEQRHMKLLHETETGGIAAWNRDKW
jgi:hypothetical protein